MEKEQHSLAARLNKGDERAAVELVELYYQDIYRFLRRIGHSKNISEDLTQECFLQAWKHIGQLKDGKALKSWLYRIASNASNYYWRRYKGKNDRSFEDIGIEEARGNEEDKIVDAEQLERLQKEILKLPVKLRQIVILHYMENLTIAETAETAGIREGTCKSRLSRALKKLRKNMVQ